MPRHRPDRNRDHSNVAISIRAPAAAKARPAKSSVSRNKALASIEKRLRLLEDREAILDVIYRYHHAMAALDCDAWLDCFTREASLQIRSVSGKSIVKLNGHREMARWYKARTTQWPKGSEGYSQVNPHIVVFRNGELAKVSSFFVTFQHQGMDLKLRSWGEYRDKLVRNDGEWRIGEKLVLTRMTNAA